MLLCLRQQHHNRPVLHIGKETVIPLSAEEVGDKVPMIIGLVVFLAIGEVVRIISAKDRKEESKGLTPELAAQRLAEEAAAEAAEE